MLALMFPKGTPLHIGTGLDEDRFALRRLAARRTSFEENLTVLTKTGSDHFLAAPRFKNPYLLKPEEASSIAGCRPPQHGKPSPSICVEQMLGANVRQNLSGSCVFRFSSQAKAIFWSR